MWSQVCQRNILFVRHSGIIFLRILFFVLGFFENSLSEAEKFALPEIEKLHLVSVELRKVILQTAVFFLSKIYDVDVILSDKRNEHNISSRHDKTLNLIGMSILFDSLTFLINVMDLIAFTIVLGDQHDNGIPVSYLKLPHSFWVYLQVQLSCFLLDVHSNQSFII